MQIFKPNEYVPSASAQDIEQLVDADRGPLNGDIAAPTWNVNNTPDGNLTAVAASLATQQTGDTTLYATDLSFASPGSQTLSTSAGTTTARSKATTARPRLATHRVRPRSSSIPPGSDPTGLDVHALGVPVATHGANADTDLRSGDIRFFDRATGQELDFISSLGLSYSTSSLGNPQIVINGLSASNTPTFTPGQYQDGSTLVQNPTTLDYILTHPDGSSETFDPTGLLLSSEGQ